MFTKQLLLLLLVLCPQQTSAFKRLQDPKKQQQSAAMAAKQQRRFAQRLKRLERETFLKQQAEEMAAHVAQKKQNEYAENLSKTARELYCFLIRPHVQKAMDQITPLLGFEFAPSIPLMRTYGDGAFTDLHTILTEVLPEATYHRHVHVMDDFTDKKLEEAGVALGKVWALRRHLRQQITRLTEQQALLAGEPVSSQDITDKLLAHYPQNTAQQKDWALQEKINATKDPKRIFQLIEEGINNNSEKAAEMKWNGLFFGWYGYPKDKAAAHQLCETYVELGHNWAIKQKLNDLEKDDSDDEENEKEFNDFMNEQLAHNNDAAIEKNFYNNLPKTNTRRDIRLLKTPFAQLGRPWAFQFSSDPALNIHENIRTVLRDLFKNLLAERKRVTSLMRALQTVNS